MVDGTAEARQAHGRAVPIKLCRATERRLSAVESQWEPNEWRREHIETEQRPGASEAHTAEGEEHVQEAVYGVCSCKFPEPGCSGP